MSIIRFAALAAFLALVNDSLAGDVSKQDAHGPAYWRAIIADQYRVPATDEASRLSMELAGYVTAIDPEWRDAFGYEILANWIHAKGVLTAADLDKLRQAFLPYADRGLGDVDSDTLFARSFALLNLKEIAAADLKMPHLTRDSFNQLFDLAERSLRAEKDLRGYVPGKGWGHATAHAADLLRVLARNEKLTRAQQARLTTAIAQRVRSAGVVFVWGEDARLALALATATCRTDVDTDAMSDWLDALRRQHRQLWSGPFEMSAYVSVRAQLNLLAQYAAILARQDKAACPESVRDAVNAALQRLN
jgi:hypothetical protein